ncbi:MAG TPA: heavy metal translocating P-type ATPase, partial [Ignavibacteria bacterium]|nr:heavy metal translocating P-type ATPase [Ignavibacteria bacterium]
MSKIKNNNGIKCHQCGNDCSGDLIHYNDKYLCSVECKIKFEKESIEIKTPSCCSSKTNSTPDFTEVTEEKDNFKFNYLDDNEIQKKIIKINGKNIASVSFFIPGIHCTSCVKMLENLYKINPGILNSKVEFLQKKIHIVYNTSAISLKEVVKILSNAGYEPVINTEETNSIQALKNKAAKKELYIKTGVAGFCLGNIMLLSLPEYFSTGKFSDPELRTFFNYLNILLSLPVFFYCSSGYFKSAFTGIRQKIISIDIPIALGISALFFRSIYEIVFFNNAGFMDSMAGLVFLLLLGKIFQSKTYETLNFERDYKSYFPVSVTIVKDKTEKSVPVDNLSPGDRIIIRNNEIIPADSILFGGTSSIDYSFVTGESMPEMKVQGEILYAGGRHLGPAIELEVVRPVSRSYLTQLWNDPAFNKKNESRFSGLTNTASKYFTIIVLAIATGAAIYWLPTDFNKALDAFTTVLIVACPCALALTTPFALGNAQRILGRNKFYLKNSSVVESLSNINSVVFDKTGTITYSGNITVKYTGTPLKEEESAYVKTLVRNSSHPLSKNIYDSIPGDEFLETDDFTEYAGKGIYCKINGNKIKIGSVRYILNNSDCTYLDLKHQFNKNAFSSSVFLSINNIMKGYYSFSNEYRKDLKEVVDDLSDNYSLSLISGDN